MSPYTHYIFDLDRTLVVLKINWSELHEKEIEIFDNLRLVNKASSELRTSKLLWKNKTQKVYSDVFVRITTPKEIIEGIGFESDQNLTNYKIYQVSGVFDK